MKHFINTLLALLMLLPALAFAEIVYTPTRLDIDAEAEWALPGFMNIGLKRGLSMTSNNVDQFFRIGFYDSATEPAKLSPCIGARAIVFYYPGYNLKQEIACREVFTMSDMRFKKEITPLTSSLSNILSLYNTQNRIKSRANGVGTSQKPKSKELEYAWLQSIAPGSVSVIAGDTVVDYNELIPLLVRSVQELSGTIEELDQQIERIRTAVNEKKLTGNQLGKIIVCSPNPTSDDVAVTLSMPQMSGSYRLISTDFNGSVVSSIDCVPDISTVTVPLSGFKSGIYHITLMYNSSVCDTYRIIKK